MSVPIAKARSATRRLRLSAAMRAELEWLAGEAPSNMARHAQIVLGRAAGMPITAVAAATGVHPNTVRNCICRFEAHGLLGLVHAGAGKPKSAAFSDAVRDEIARVAMQSPARAGEAYTQWSLRRLRTHLMRRGVVQSISVEGLRQVLGGLPLPPAHWRRLVRRADPLTPDVRRALESLVQGPRRERRLRAQIVVASGRGLNEAEIAAALHVGRGTVRRWLRRFRRAGILGLQTLPRRAAPSQEARQAIVRLACSDPRRHGMNRPTWSLRALRRAVLRHRVVRTISIDNLRRILRDAGVECDQTPAALRDREQAPAVG
ncbi:MAG: helix-turn-helix domain-containing protein [Candidatus Binatia bacterium]